jgi:hypothetical protein
LNLKKNNHTSSIDMTEYGPISDKDGHMDFSQNFCNVLLALCQRKKLPKNRTKIMVLFSVIYGSSDYPRRGSIEKYYTFGYLCRLYKKYEGIDFNPKTYAEELSHKRNVRLEAYEIQGRKTMAWAELGRYSHITKLMKQQNILDSLPEEQRDEQRKKFEKENGSELLRIG